MSGVGDFPILGAPSISLSTFRSVLTGAGSPAAPEAIGMYDAAIQYGVDPAVLLAVFQHESGFGKAGIAVGRQNGFGSRYFGDTAEGGTNAGGWYRFPTWTAGAQYTARLLGGPMYGGSGAYSTARTFPNRYAPSSDGNNPSSYGASVAGAIAGWSGKGGALADPTVPLTAHEAHVAHLAAIGAKPDTGASVVASAAGPATPKAAPVASAPAAGPVALPSLTGAGLAVGGVVAVLALVLLFVILS
jgi:hypothetical protein